MPNTDVKRMEECAEICHECQDHCLRTISHCLALGGMHASREHQVMLACCADMCNLSHTFLIRQSPQHVYTCRACAEVCRECAEDCDRLGDDDPVMKDCAEACRRCAESCERMATARV